VLTRTHNADIPLAHHSTRSPRSPLRSPLDFTSPGESSYHSSLNISHDSHTAKEKVSIRGRLQKYESSDLLEDNQRRWLLAAIHTFDEATWLNEEGAGETEILQTYQKALSLFRCCDGLAEMPMIEEEIGYWIHKLQQKMTRRRKVQL